jgi:hypothetical protein
MVLGIKLFLVESGADPPAGATAVMSPETPSRTETITYEKNGHAWSKSY